MNYLIKDVPEEINIQKHLEEIEEQNALHVLSKMHANGRPLKFRKSQKDAQSGFKRKTFKDILALDEDRKTRRLSRITE